MASNLDVGAVLPGLAFGAASMAARPFMCKRPPTSRSLALCSLWWTSLRRFGTRAFASVCGFPKIAVQRWTLGSALAYEKGHPDLGFREDRLARIVPSYSNHGGNDNEGANFRDGRNLPELSSDRHNACMILPIGLAVWSWTPTFHRLPPRYSRLRRRSQMGLCVNTQLRQVGECPCYAI